MAPGLDDIEAVGRAAFETIPPVLRRHVDGVVIHVAEFPDDDTLRDLGLESPFDLSGLYHGVPITERSVSAPAHDVDRIFLYRQPILAEWCETGEDLTWLVRHILIHEIGHHFGFSDDDIHRIEAMA